MSSVLRAVLFIVRAENDIIKTDYMHTFLNKMKMGIHLEKLR